MQRILVATRKGLFIYNRASNDAWTIQQRAFVGDPVSMVLHDQRDDTLYAALALGHFGSKLHRSDDQGATWQEIATPAFPAKPSTQAEDDPTPWSVSLIWSLEAGGNTQPGRLWCGTIPGGLFRSDDRGDHWELVGSLWDRPERRTWFGGGFDHAGISSICVDPRDPRIVTLGVSIGGVWRTYDDGATWQTFGKGLRAEYTPAEQAHEFNQQDLHRLVQSPSAPEYFWVQHHNGIFLSTDDCATFKEIDNVAPSSFGFALAVHPKDATTAWFVPAVKDACRVPVDNQFVVNRTTDAGKTFATLRNGLPQTEAYDLVYRHGLACAADARTLALGSTTGNLWWSGDAGDSWQALSFHLPPIACVLFADAANT